MPASGDRDLLQDALIKIRSLRAEMAAMQQARREPIAIVGAGCRFPGGVSDPDSYWRLLSDGVDAVRDVPPGRWNVGRYYDPDPDAPGKSYLRQGGFLDEIDRFDAAFFGISPREAVRMDPQQRLLLEVSWEALEHAGIAPDSLNGSTTGVYVGMMTPDYAYRQVHHLQPETIDPYMLTGNDFSCPAGRLSYVLGLQGPAMVVATACSSSLVSLHLACQALRGGECELALAGGVNLVLDPVSNIMLSKLRALARDGRCKAFDAAADGYGRGEGCGMMVLERLSDALTNRHRVLAVIRGSAVNHDGSSAGLTVPNGPAQEKVLRRALESAGVAAADVAYVEAHGTGTPLGDPIEIRSLARAFGAGRQTPLQVGSVKTNVGHLEAAAGVAGVLKVALALQHGKIPAHLHLKTPNPHIPWNQLPVEVVRELRPWPAGNGLRIAGVSAFGLSGVNAHVVLEAAPPAPDRPAAEERQAQLLTISAATETALREQVRRYAMYLDAHAEADWEDVCYTAHCGRAHLAHRMALVAESAATARPQLSEAFDRRFRGEFRTAFVFPDERILSPAIGQQLYSTQPVFRGAFDRCAAALQQIYGWPLHDLMTPDAHLNEEQREGLLFAVQCGLAELWRAWGIEPSKVIAFGAGEDAAAVAAGAVSIEQAVHRMASRRNGAAVPLRRSAAAGAGTPVSIADAEVVTSSAPESTFSQARIPMVSGLTGERRDKEITDPMSNKPFPDVQSESLPWVHLWMGMAPAEEDGKIRGMQLASLRGGEEWRAMLESLRWFYTAGADIRWNAVDQPDVYGRRLLALPTYPFQRERYWALDEEDEIGAEASPSVPASNIHGKTGIDAELPSRLRNLDEAARNDVVRTMIAARTAAVLRLKTPPESDSILLDLGLDSLMAVELKSWMEEQFGCSIELGTLLSGATIEDVAAQVTAATGQPVAWASPAVIATTEPATLPLSYGQKALWFIHQSDPSSSAYNVGIALRIRGDADASVLRQAWALLVRRHAMLRTRFADVDGDPVQHLDEGLPLCFEEVDACSWTEDELKARVAAAHRSRFDLAHGPVLRVSIFRRKNDAHVLLLSLHHIAGDALSFWTLLEEMEVTYAALRRGRAVTLPEQTATYADFIRWQQQMLAGPEGERLWQFWSEQLAGELPVLALPADRPRPAVQTFHGASHILTIAEPLTQRLRSLARTSHSTLYSVLMAAFGVLLSRFSGQDDILIGSATAARPSQFGGVAGYFTNPVVVRIHLDGNPAFLELLEQVRRMALAALEHQHFPFPLLVERLQPRRDPSRSPIFQADFALLKNPPLYRRGELAEGAEAPLVLRPFELPEEEGQFDLSLHVTEEEHHLRAAFKFNTDLFDATTVARIACAYETLLCAIGEDPQQKIDALRLLSDAQREEVLALGRGAVAERTPVTLQQLFALQAARTPHAVAVETADLGTGADARFTYAELDCQANRLAHYLRTCGVGQDVLVGICLERSFSLMAALLGVLKAGGAYLPMDPVYPPERLAFMMRDARTPVLLTTRDVADRMAVPEGVAVVRLDEAEELLREFPVTAPDFASSPDDLAYVIYTSGSTGTPKGAMITHRGLANYLLWALDAYRVREGTGAPVNTSISFDATVTSLFLPLIAGGRVVMLPEQGVVEALGEVLRRREQFSLVKLTPAHLEALSSLLAGEDLRGCAHAFVIGGEALRGETLDFWRQAAPATRLINEYGPTETVVGCSIHEAAGPVSGAVPIGRAIANTQLYILDRNGQPVPQGVAGELYIGGAGVARGYLNRPDLTAGRFVPNPFGGSDRLYRSGDFARFLPDGNLEFLGRGDDQIKIRGYRIEPAEIESRLLQHAQVREALVSVTGETNEARQLVAWFMSEGPTPTADELSRWLAETLPAYMVPAHFVEVSRFPLTPNGKVDRRALPRPSTGTAPRIGITPRDPMEMKLAALWEEVLEVRPVGVRDDFFALGGHSLLAVRLMTRIQREFDVKIPLAAILRGPTVEQLAEILREQAHGHASHPALAPIRPGSHDRPFFCVPGAGGNVLYLYNLARCLGSDQAFYGLQGAGLEGETAPHTSVEAMAAYYIEAVRQVQPHGPYFLGGHSLGGWAAFEMAQQLQRQGEEVAVVAVIDTAVPLLPTGQEEDRAQWDQSRWIAELTNRIAQLLRPDLVVTTEELRRLDAEAQMQFFRDALVSADLFPREARLEHLRHVVDVFKAHSQVQYRLPEFPLPTRIALLRTPAPPVHAVALANDPTWGWSAVGPVDVHLVPGAHLSVLREPYVKELAEHLAQCLG